MEVVHRIVIPRRYANPRQRSSPPATSQANQSSRPICRPQVYTQPVYRGTKLPLQCRNGSLVANPKQATRPVKGLFCSPGEASSLLRCRRTLPLLPKWMSLSSPRPNVLSRNPHYEPTLGQMRGLARSYSEKYLNAQPCLMPRSSDCDQMHARARLRLQSPYCISNTYTLGTWVVLLS